MRIARLSWPLCAAVLVLAGCGDRALAPKPNARDSRGVVVSEARGFAFVGGGPG